MKLIKVLSCYEAALALVENSQLLGFKGVSS